MFNKSDTASELGIVCHEVAAILRGRILVGHGLGHDLEVLMIKHPKSKIRDTSKYTYFCSILNFSKLTFELFRYKVFRTVVNGATPSLKRLAQQFLGIEIQSGEHSSVISKDSLTVFFFIF